LATNSSIGLLRWISARRALSGSPGAHRQQHQRRHSNRPPAPKRRAAHRRRHGGIARGDEPTRYFDAGRLRFGRADQAAFAVTRDFLELVTIDGDIARPAGGRNTHR
jgi:hypothetical protein